MRRLQQIHRTWYKTNATEDSVGTLAQPFPGEDEMNKIVHVDWSVKGEVEVTWLTFSILDF